MPDNNPSDGQVVGEGTANTQTSQPADSPPSIDAAELFTALQAYPGFQQYVKSQAQSKHDKRIGKIEKTLAEQMAAVDALEAQGLPRELAVEWLEMRNSQAQNQPQQADTVVDPNAVAGQQQAQGQDDPVEAVAVNLGFDPNSAEVLAIRKEGGTQVEQIRKLTAKFQAGKGVEPNPAATMPTSTGPPASTNLQAQYEAERDGIGLGRGKAHLHLALKDKYRKLGLDIL